MAVKLLEDMSKKELINYIESIQSAMFERIDSLSNEVISLKKEVETLTINEKDLKLQLQIEKEKNKKLIAARYLSQKNQIVLDMPTLFDDIEAEALKIEEAEKEEVITIGEHQRIRRPKEKHIDYSSLERREEILPVPQGEDICPECGAKMKLKRYEEKEELVVIPSQVYVRVTKIPVMICEECQSVNEEGKSTCRTVSHPAPLLPRSKVSPELLAYIMDMKYNCGLPLDAIEKMFARQGVIIPKQNMCNWVIGSVKYLKPIYNLMKKDLLAIKVIQADETVTQCLNEEGKPATSTSYMWVYTAARSLAKIVLYEYQPTRSGDVPKEFLEGFVGYLVTDRYDGYGKVENVIRCYCNMHGLKYFKEAYKLLPNNKERKNSDEAKAVAMYQNIFHVEDEIQKAALEKYSDVEKRFEYIRKRRNKEIKPLFDKFFAWLEEISARNAGRYTMNKAINYILKDREGFTRFIEDGRIPISNQASEQNIRPFCVIRNRCKFYVSTKGAHASALIYSIVITCVQNNINPYMYLMYLFEELPNMDLNDADALRKYLPYSNQLPDYTRIMSKSEIKAILKEPK